MCVQRRRSFKCLFVSCGDVRFPHGTMLDMDRRFFENLQRIVGIDNVMVDEPMSAHTTFKIGGPAEYFVIPTDTAQVREAIVLCRT